MCTPVTPAVPYLLLGLQGVQWAVGNSCGARKLARTPHVNQKKKIIKKKMESIRKPRTNEQTTSVRRTWKKRTKNCAFSLLDNGIGIAFQMEIWNRYHSTG
jgi:hypothetical protein